VSLKDTTGSALRLTEGTEASNFWLSCIESHEALAAGLPHFRVGVICRYSGFAPGGAARLYLPRGDCSGGGAFTYLSRGARDCDYGDPADSVSEPTGSGAQRDCRQFFSTRSAFPSFPAVRFDLLAHPVL